MEYRTRYQKLLWVLAVLLNSGWLVWGQSETVVPLETPLAPGQSAADQAWRDWAQTQIKQLEAAYMSLLESEANARESLDEAVRQAAKASTAEERALWLQQEAEYKAKADQLYQRQRELLSQQKALSQRVGTLERRAEGMQNQINDLAIAAQHPLSGYQRKKDVVGFFEKWGFRTLHQTLKVCRRMFVSNDDLEGKVDRILVARGLMMKSETVTAKPAKSEITTVVPPPAGVATKGNALPPFKGGGSTPAFPKFPIRLIVAFAFGAALFWIILFVLEPSPEEPEKARPWQRRIRSWLMRSGVRIILGLAGGIFAAILVSSLLIIFLGWR